MNATNAFYKAARKHFVPENNLGIEASHMESMVRGITNLTTYWQHEDDRPGVCMTNPIKENYLSFSDLKMRLGQVGN